MTRKLRTTRITIERHKVTVIRKSSQRLSIYCERCRTQARAFTQEEAAALFQIQIGEINLLLGTDKIHFVETIHGSLPLICGGQEGAKN
jgi:hypothetical protein